MKYDAAVSLTDVPWQDDPYSRGSKFFLQNKGSLWMFGLYKIIPTDIMHNYDKVEQHNYHVRLLDRPKYSSNHD